MKGDQLRWVLAPLNSPCPFLAGRPVRIISNQEVEYEVEGSKERSIVRIDPKDTFQMATGNFSDMCEMTVLNEPEVMRNLILRYSQDQIFTYIGPTLIALNPYRVLPKLFNSALIAEIRRTLLDGGEYKTPHVYAVTVRAYIAMVKSNCKQAIVISGESGAGKTESTKYCMQVITCMAEEHSSTIERRILACNPLLQAFGNSKTVRNDNSSRFGKYVQIFFDAKHNIVGANILRYLLEKSRVVAVAPGERSFHAFYALTASKAYGTLQPSSYQCLRQSNCYTAGNINDQEFFKEVNVCMNQVGFSQAEQDLIWKTLAAVLHLSNVGFDDKAHKTDESQPCGIENRKDLEKAAGYLGVGVQILERMLLFEKKIILKETTAKAYSRGGCEANRNTLSKAVYNAVFEMIIKKIAVNLGYDHQKNNEKDLVSMNLLDIFGFQNFGENSLEQLCINFTNERLLKEYNAYIFEREMEILRQDGLDKELNHIRAPTNDNVIALLSGKLSVFSLINDNSSGPQYKDEDIVHGLQKDIKDGVLLKFDKMSRLKFTVKHSQCEVTYITDNFRSKNQDKLNTEIEGLLKNILQAEQSPTGKTLLHKFVNQIDRLILELGSSTNHFIRCIKPNENKAPKSLDANYLLTQVRYLGVFQTIQIRQKTFPSRHSYQDFYQQFKVLFSDIKTNDSKDFVMAVLKKMQVPQNECMIGAKRIYLSSRVDDELSQKYLKYMKVRQESARKILKAYRKYSFRKNILKKLKILVKRKNIWRKFAQSQRLKLTKIGFSQIKRHSEEILRRLKEKKLKKKDPEKMTKIFHVLDRIMKQKQAYSFRAVKERALESKEKELAKINLARVDVSPTNEVQSHAFNESFANDTMLNTSVAINLDQEDYSSIAFEKTMKVPPFDPTKGNIKKLELILLEKYKTEVVGGEEEFFSPNSSDCAFKVEETEQLLLNKIICFDAHGFFMKVLRERKTFIGSKKTYLDILVAKGRPLTKSLSVLGDADQDKAIKIFKVIVRIGQESKLDNVFKLIQNLVNLCQVSTPQLKNEVFLQLLKESATSNQLIAVRIYQSLAVFLHIYSPETDFLTAGLHIFFAKLGQGHLSEKQEQYVRYLFKKIIRKIENPPLITFMPIKYQMMALMCKRQISVPVYLPVGNSVLIRVESYQTFSDIKTTVMTELGINTHRFKPFHFKFFEIINFQNEELEESPLNDTQIVWDSMTYWELAKEKYRDKDCNPPSFYLMMKMVYPIEVHENDTQGIQLTFAQCYFDYFIGRIRLSLNYMGLLAGCVKMIKLAHRPAHEILGSYPMWIVKDHDENTLVELMQSQVQSIKEWPIQKIKFRFLKICEKNPLSMAMAIPTETKVQKIKLFLKPRKLYLAEDGVVLQENLLKNIVRWAIDKEKFVFDVKGEKENRSHTIYTEFAQACSQYLYDLSKRN